MSNSQPEEKVVRTICENCSCQCGCLVYVRDGKAVKIEGDPDHPLNHGFLCPMGLSALQLVYHPDRNIYPRKRVGEPGAGKWQRVSWDEALDDIAQRLLKVRDEYGPESIIYTFGTYPKNGSPVYCLLMKALGSPGILIPNGHYCLTPHMTADVPTAGSGFSCVLGMPDFRDSALIILWGCNLYASSPPLGKQILEAIYQKGAKLIVIDPRFTEFASKADLYLQPRPNTDAALALAMCNVIIEEGLYDHSFVEKWTVGFDALRERAKEYPPDRAADITWIPKEKIIEAARLYATIKPATLIDHTGTSMNFNSVQTCRATGCLIGLCGNLDIEGGNTFNAPYAYPDIRENWHMRKLTRATPEEEEAQIGKEEFPFFAGPKSLRGYQHPPGVINAMLTGKPHPIKALIATNNYILAFEDSRRAAAAMRELDIMVAVDFFMTPTCEVADYVLPPANWLEREDLCDSHRYRGFTYVSPKTIEPVGECRDEADVVFDLMRRMKLKCPVPCDSNRSLIAYQLAPAGVTFEDVLKKGALYGTLTEKKYEKGILRADGKPGFNTPSGKFEFYASRLKEFGYDPLPYYQEPVRGPVSTPKLAREYPLILMSGSRLITRFNSLGVTIPWLRELLPDPILDINTNTAMELGINDGDWVWIETPRGHGRVKQRAHLTLGMHPRVVHAQALWYYPEEDDMDRKFFEPNINSILSMDGPYEPIVGTTLLSGELCKVYKATS